MGMLMAALKYGYSNTRAKAMETKLIDSSVMRSIADAKTVDEVLAILFQTDYNAAIVKFGGLEISNVMLDFAISENLAQRLNRLAEFTPKSDRHIIRKIIERWDLGNVKLVLEAAERKMAYDAISRYIVSSDEFSAESLKEAMRNEGVEHVLEYLMHNRTYRDMLSGALAAYKKTRNVLDAIAMIDSMHYKELGELSLELMKGHDKSAQLLRMDIDMRNIITLMRAKRLGLKFADVSKNLIKNGDVDSRSLARIYNSSDDVVSFVLKTKSFDMNGAVEVYKQNGQLLSFEISMRNQIFNMSRKLLRTSVLSFGALVDYVYLKEIEVFTLRALIKSKEYGLSKDEISKLVVWNL